MPRRCHLSPLSALFLALLVLLPTFSYADDDANRALFRGLYHCDLPAVRQALDDGADPNASFPLELTPEFNIGLSPEVEYPPLVYIQTLLSCMDGFGALTPDQRDARKRTRVEIAEVLVRAGANMDKEYRTFQMGDDRLIPVLHVPFYTDAPGYHAVDMFERLVALGQDPMTRDSNGYSVLKRSFRERLSVAQLARLVKAGADYNARDSTGTNETAFFPPSPIDDRKQFAELLALGHALELEYEYGHYPEPQSHPAVREIGNVVLPFYRQPGEQPAILKSYLDLLDLLGPGANTGIGDQRLHPLVFVMAWLCPTTTISSGIASFPFDYSHELSSQEKHWASRTYRWFIELLANPNFDGGYEDDNNLSLLSYGVHLCPLEVNRKLFELNRTVPSADELNRALKTLRVTTLLYPGTTGDKIFGALEAFNRDPRTVLWLNELGVPLEGISRDLTTNADDEVQRALTEATFAWRPLSRIGLEPGVGIVLPASFYVAYEEYSDIAKTVIALSDNGKGDLSFTGIPVTVGVGREHRFLGINIPSNSTRFTYTTDGSEFHYNFHGGVFDYGQKVTFAEYATPEQARLIVEQTVTQRTKTTIKAESHEIRIGGPQSPFRMEYSRVVAGVPRVVSRRLTGRVRFHQLVGEYLDAQVSDSSVTIQLDAERLAQEQPEVFRLWRYITASQSEKAGLREEMRKTLTPTLSAYLLDLVEVEPKTRSAEEESMSFLEMLLVRELTNALRFPLTPLKNALHNFTPVSSAGESFQTVYGYLISGTDETGAFKTITGDFLRLQHFILTGTLPLASIYAVRYASVAEQIAQSADGVASRLGLSDRQKQVLSEWAKTYE